MNLLILWLIVFIPTVLGLSPFQVKAKIYESFNTVIKLEDDPYLSTIYHIPDHASVDNVNIFNFSKGNAICPGNNCNQRFIDGILYPTASDTLVLSGKLRIEDVKQSTSNIKNYKILDVLGKFKIYNFQDNLSLNKTLEFFRGTIGIGGEANTSNPDFKYNITKGIFELPSKILSIKAYHIS